MADGYKFYLSANHIWLNYDETPREQAKEEAVELAVAAGAIRETVEFIDVEDVPLQYYPGNTCRVKIKAAGDLA